MGRSAYSLPSSVVATDQSSGSVMAASRNTGAGGAATSAITESGLVSAMAVPTATTSGAPTARLRRAAGSAATPASVPRAEHCTPPATVRRAGACCGVKLSAGFGRRLAEARHAAERTQTRIAGRSWMFPRKQEKKQVFRFRYLVN